MEIKRNENDVYNITISVNNLKEIINLDGKDYLLVEKDQLENFINKLNEYKEDINKLHICIANVLEVMGIYDKNTGDIKESIKTGDESYFKHILKSLKDIVFLLTQSKMGFKSSEKELLEKFAFIKNIMPLIEKHGKSKRK